MQRKHMKVCSHVFDLVGVQMEGQEFETKMVHVEDSTIGLKMNQVEQEKQVEKHWQPFQDKEDYNEVDYQFDVYQQQVSPLPKEEGMMEATMIQIEDTWHKESQVVEGNLP